MREVEQVAAVCYRVRGGELEFLLVQTRGSGRWTFPKGGAEAGLTHAQAAAIEAFEEAGVHGRIEEAAFARYLCRGRNSSHPAVVSAHLCEVLRLSAPKEAGRNRTWFPAREARARLRDGRKSEEGREFVRVVDKALDRIRRFSRECALVPSQHAGFTSDEWNRVEIEAGPSHRSWTVDSLPPRIQRLTSIQPVEFGEDSAEMRAGEAIPFGSPSKAGRASKLLSLTKKFKALGPGTRVQ